MTKRYLHFTIGPVQGFVAQSRRTRDLLASSFLLSYLSGHAMMAVMQAGGEIVFPYVQERNGADELHGIRHPLLQAISCTLAGETVENGPWMGSLPNRFKAKVDHHFDPKLCEKAVQDAWQRVAKAVWDYSMPGMEEYGKETREIWERQVKGFWEIAWVIGEESDLLDRRKNWRTHVPTEEPGDKCTLVSNLQELSGHFRSAQQQEFWEELRKKLEPYDLAENERLSAIGLIKRLFPLVAKEAIGWEFPKEAIHFPSVTYLSAFPWVLRTIREQKEESERFAVAAQEYGMRASERGDAFPGILREVERGTFLHHFANLEGPSFFGKWEKPGDKDDSALKHAYSELKDKMGGEPSPYYALLLMDGDNLGSLLSSQGQKVSRALFLFSNDSLFSDDMDQVVRKYNGVTVYAGGDDVLALLPLDQALAVAVQLRERYLRAFAEVGLQSTISAVILYAHYYAPLKGVLQYAHYLLDEVAKERSGRDSLAMAVWKRSGPDWNWYAKWEKVYDRREVHPVTVLEKLAEHFTGDKENVFSGSFLYKWRELYERASFSEDPEENKQVLIDLIAADYLRIEREKKAADREKAKKKVAELVDLCFTSGKFKTDGALLVRFLGRKGEGRI